MSSSSTWIRNKTESQPRTQRHPKLGRNVARRGTKEQHSSQQHDTFPRLTHIFRSLSPSDDRRYQLEAAPIDIIPSHGKTSTPRSRRSCRTARMQRRKNRRARRSLRGSGPLATVVKRSFVIYYRVSVAMRAGKRYKEELQKPCHSCTRARERIQTTVRFLLRSHQ